MSSMVTQYTDVTFMSVSSALEQKAKLTSGTLNLAACLHINFRFALGVPEALHDGDDDGDNDDDDGDGDGDDDDDYDDQ